MKFERRLTHRAIGDVVRIKGEDRPMTVSALRDDIVKCLWLDGGKLCHADLPIGVLMVSPRGTDVNYCYGTLEAM